MKNMLRGTGTLVWFLIGTAAGGITALLIAPAKGSVTRRRLRDGADKTVHDGKEMVANAAATIKGVASEKGHAMGASARNQVNAVRGAVSEAKDAYHRELDNN
jgi:gas vesicle protein